MELCSGGHLAGTGVDVVVVGHGDTVVVVATVVVGGTRTTHGQRNRRPEFTSTLRDPHPHQRR